MKNGEIGVLFWNTWCTAKPSKILGRLEELEESHSLDLLCLSEVSSKRPGLLQLLRGSGWATYFTPTTEFNERSSEGICLASRDRLAKWGFATLAISRGIRGIKRRNLAQTRLIRGVQDPINIATAHMSYPTGFNASARAQERTNLCAALPKERSIFGGDLNTTIGRQVVEDLQAEGYVKLTDPNRVGTWQARLGRVSAGPTLELDHIFATPDIAAACRIEVIDSSHPSNHNPIIVHIDTKT